MSAYLISRWTFLLVSTANLNNKTIEERIEKLEELSKIKTLRSCHEYAMYGITASGTYQIDPDGELLGEKSLPVFDEHLAEEAEEMVLEEIRHIRNRKIKFWSMICGIMLNDVECCVSFHPNDPF